MTTVIGDSEDNDGVRGFSKSFNHAGVVGTNTGSGMGVLTQRTEGMGLAAKGGNLAGFFNGDVEVTGDIRLKNADCAEDFDIAGLAKVEPGTVMIIDKAGSLRQGEQAYDKRVAGVISSADNYKLGIVLATSAPAVAAHTNGLPRYKLKQAIAYLNEHLAEDVTLDAIAQELNISQYYFCRLFKQSMGISPHKYRTQQRMELAKQLLADKLSVAEVADRVGFSNQSHFTQQFRKHVGTTPGGYRNSL